MFDGVIRARHGEGFRGRRDAVAGAEGEHGVGGRGAAERRGRERLLTDDHGEADHGHRLGNGTDGVQATFGFQRGDVGVPVEVCVRGVKDEVEAVRSLREFIGVARVQCAVGAEFQGFLALRIAGGEGSDFAAPGA